MRPIDADKLKSHYAWWPENERTVLDQIVDVQPTVETVVRGEWKPSDDYKGYVTCSRCRNCYVEPGWVINRKWKYCPNCGAKMDGGDHNAAD